MSKELHNVEIIHDPRFMVRAWGTVCSCGWKGAFLDEHTAKKSKELHVERYAASSIPREQQSNEST